MHRFYQGYLGDKVEGLWESHGGSDMDSKSYEDYVQATIKLHNQILKDTSQFQTICFRQDLTSSTPAIYRDELHVADGIWTTAKRWIDNSSLNWNSVLDSLSTGQTKYHAEDFKLCTAKVVPHTKQLDGCGIGYVCFSRIVMNADQTKALLYFEFMCGGNCGFGDILMLEKEGVHWTIRNTLDLWIS